MHQSRGSGIDNAAQKMPEIFLDPGIFLIPCRVYSGTSQLDQGDIMNKTMIRGKWRQARGGVKFEWGRLTDNERRMIDGKIDQILGVLQERYGYTQERATAALRHYLGTDAPKAVLPPTTTPKGRILFGSAVGLAIIAAAGWVTFAKIFSGQPATLGEADEETFTDADDRFEPEDFEVEMMGYEAALD